MTLYVHTVSYRVMSSATVKESALPRVGRHDEELGFMEEDDDIFAHSGRP
jgi:hypothetical protein